MLLKLIEKQHQKSKYITDIRGVFLIHDNADDNTCKLDQDFREAETVIRPSNSPYSPDLNPCYFSCSLY